MGFYDRDYARDAQPSFLRDFQAAPTLVIALTIVYLAQLIAPPRGGLTDWLQLDPPAIFHGEIWRLFTALFIHDPGNWLNLVWNLLILWFFGSQVELRYGWLRFLLIYLLSGLAGNAAWCLMHLWQPQPLLIFGSAPAVTAVLVLCTLHDPRQMVLLIILPVPLWLITLLYVGKDVVALVHQLGGLARPNVALVHVTGAACAGLVYWWPGICRRLAELRAHHTFPTVQPRKRSAHSQAEVDAILEKLSRQGKDALTPQDWEILHQASEEYRRQR